MKLATGNDTVRRYQSIRDRHAKPVIRILVPELRLREEVRTALERHLHDASLDGLQVAFGSEKVETQQHGNSVAGQRAQSPVQPARDVALPRLVDGRAGRECLAIDCPLERVVIAVVAV